MRAAWISFGLAACGTVPAHPTAAAAVTSLCAEFEGTVGVYVRDLRTGETIERNADEVFPTASLIKVPILARVLERVQLGELDYRAPLTYLKERLYSPEDLLGHFADGGKIDIATLCWLMVSLSDNTAALWLQELAGTGVAINAWLAGHGLAQTRVNSRTPGREAERELFGWGQTTPREMAELLVRIHAGRVGSTAACEEMSRVLARTFWDSEALAAIPPSVAVLSKQGAVSHARSEVALVQGPSGDYVFCVMTKEQRDRSWGRDNAGYVLLRAMSKVLWSHFEPGQPYAPPPGAERFQ